MKLWTVAYFLWSGAPKSKNLNFWEIYDIIYIEKMREEEKKMLRGIQFNSSKFDKTDDNNLMDVLTTNTIILCENTKVRHIITNEIRRVLNHECEFNDDNDYCCEPTDKLKYKYVVNYLPTTTFRVDDEQLITVTVEAPYILTAKEPEDIWFAAVDKDDVISVYPLRIFKEYEEIWESGQTYKYTVNGRFGCYVKYANIVCGEKEN